VTPLAAIGTNRTGTLRDLPVGYCPGVTPRPDAGKQAALDASSEVEGWLSTAQGSRLWEAARRVPPGGTVVEIGSFRGRSAVVLASAAPEGAAIVAIDPHAGGDRGPGEIAPRADRGEADNQAFHANLRRAGVDQRVRLVRKASGEALEEVSGGIDLLYIDGAHRYRPASDDISAWGARVRPGGMLLIHDAFNAIGVTGALLRLVVFGSSWRYLGRTGSLAEYRRDAVRGAPRVANTARQLAQLGYFARMLNVKVALTARMYPVARLMGHRTRDWPY
jgi:predicted O-methyltransferase YrrM